MSKERLEDKLVKFRQRLALGYVNMDILNQAHEIHELVMEQAERVQELEEDINRLNGALHYQLVQENIRNEESRNLRMQNKRYREAQEIIEQVYKENYVRNAYGYEDGFSDGLDTAINIIDEALEGESKETVKHENKVWTYEREKIT